MAHRTYTENPKTDHETSINDRKVIVDFIRCLDDTKLPDMDPVFRETTGEVEADIIYSLKHPYEGENFTEYIGTGQNVTADVEVVVRDDERSSVYNGTLTEDPANIFDLEYVTEEVHYQEPDTNLGQDVGSETSAAAD